MQAGQPAAFAACIRSAFECRDCSPTSLRTACRSVMRCTLSGFLRSCNRFSANTMDCSGTSTGAGLSLSEPVLNGVAPSSQCHCQHTSSACTCTQGKGEDELGFDVDVARSLWVFPHLSVWLHTALERTTSTAVLAPLSLHSRRMCKGAS